MKVPTKMFVIIAIRPIFYMTLYNLRNILATTLESFNTNIFQDMMVKPLMFQTCTIWSNKKEIYKRFKYDIISNVMERKPEPAIYKIQKKIRYRSKLSLGIIYGLNFRILTASYFPQSWVQKTGLIFYLADFHWRNWYIPAFYKNKTQHWALFSTKTNQGFIFTGPTS